MRPPRSLPVAAPRGGSCSGPAKPDPRKRLGWVAALIALGAGSTAHGATEATKAVVKAIEAKDCAGAVRELNTAMAGSSPEAWLLGGAMFEQGLCLKQNVERASRLYLRAAEAGRADARSRLAALYASPTAGPDKGAALWWAQQAALPLPAPCAVAADARTDPDRFAAQLSAWPTARLDGCVYAAGVIAAIDAEFALKADEGTKDGVQIDFQPDTGKVVVSFASMGQVGNEQRAQLGTGLRLESYAHDYSADQLRAMQTQSGKAALADDINTVARDALSRYPRPATVDRSWRVQLRSEGPRAH